MKIIANNLKDTEKLGRIIAKCAEKGTVICLDGELGAGKTSLARFIAKELGVKDYIVSPTFTIIKDGQPLAADLTAANAQAAASNYFAAAQTLITSLKS